MSLPKRGYKMSNDERIAILEANMNHIHKSLVSIIEEQKRSSYNLDIRLDDMTTKINKRIDELNSKIESSSTITNGKVDSCFHSLNNRLWTNFTWTLGVCAAVFAVMAHGFHWF